MAVGSLRVGVGTSTGRASGEDSALGLALIEGSVEFTVRVAVANRLLIVVGDGLATHLAASAGPHASRLAGAGSFGGGVGAGGGGACVGGPAAEGEGRAFRRRVGGRALEDAGVSVLDLAAVGRVDARGHVGDGGAVLGLAHSVYELAGGVGIAGSLIVVAGTTGSFTRSIASPHAVVVEGAVTGSSEGSALRHAVIVVLGNGATVGAVRDSSAGLLASSIAIDAAVLGVVEPAAAEDGSAGVVIDTKSTVVGAIVLSGIPCALLVVGAGCDVSRRAGNGVASAAVPNTVGITALDGGAAAEGGSDGRTLC